MAFPAQATSLICHEPVLDLQEFEREFTVCRVLDRVRARILRIHQGVVELGPYLSCKEKGPPNPDRPDGIQFVRVKQDFCFNGSGREISTKPVGADTVNNVGLLFSGEGCILQDRPGHFASLLGMAYGPPGPVLEGAAHIVEIGRDLQGFHIRPFDLPDMPAEPMDAQGVVPMMTPRGI